MTGRRPAARAAVLAASALLAAPVLHGDDHLTLHGVAAGRALAVESREPWISGAFGRLTEGRRSDTFDVLARGDAQLGLDWTPTESLLLHVHATARSEPEAAPDTAPAGLTEAFLQYRSELSPRVALRARGGLMFLPTSRENVDPLWQSPYTLTLSAINSWIGEEMRPIGVELLATFGEPGRTRLELAGMPFVESDSAGTLLAWRGWAMGRRLSVAGETLPLPPLPTLAPGGAFADQLDSGTRPIDELDGKLGWHARGRVSRAGVGLLQAAWTDNRGDRGLHRGQYAWDTRFVSLAAEAQLGALRLVAEAVDGTSGMGPRELTHVDIRFRAAYALLSWASAGEGLRVSARYDRFRNQDEDGGAEPNQESGWALTAAALYAPRPWLRVGLEYLELRSDRPAAEFSGTPLSTDARRLELELRLRF